VTSAVVSVAKVGGKLFRFLAHSIDLKVLPFITGQAQNFALLKHSAVLYSVKPDAINWIFGL